MTYISRLNQNNIKLVFTRVILGICRHFKDKLFIYVNAILIESLGSQGAVGSLRALVEQRPQDYQVSPISCILKKKHVIPYKKALGITNLVPHLWKQ